MESKAQKYGYVQQKQRLEHRKRKVKDCMLFIITNALILVLKLAQLLLIIMILKSGQLGEKDTLKLKIKKVS